MEMILEGECKKIKINIDLMCSIWYFVYLDLVDKFIKMLWEIVFFKKKKSFNCIDIWDVKFLIYSLEYFFIWI